MEEIRELIEMAIQQAYMSGQNSIMMHELDNSIPIMKHMEYMKTQELNITIVCRLIEMKLDKSD